MSNEEKIARRRKFSRIFSKSERAALTEAESAEYEWTLKNMRDCVMDRNTRLAELEEARAEGYAEGYAEGLELARMMTPEIVVLLLQGIEALEISQRLNVAETIVNQVAQVLRQKNASLR